MPPSLPPVDPKEFDLKEFDLKEFDRQVSTLVTLGYPALLGLTDAELEVAAKPLRDRLAEVSAVAADAAGVDQIPFVLVVSRTVVPYAQAMELTSVAGRAGFADFDPADLDRFVPIPAVHVPDGRLYLLLDVDTGSEFLGVRPDDALPALLSQDRSPLTVDEGIALLTQRPDMLRRNKCFQLLASRCGDRRVPGLWLSQRRPKLGWCWGGNLHTWLGAASCDRRVGGA